MLQFWYRVRPWYRCFFFAFPSAELCVCVVNVKVLSIDATDRIYFFKTVGPFEWNVRDSRLTVRAYVNFYQSLGPYRQWSWSLTKRSRARQKRKFWRWSLHICSSFQKQMKMLSTFPAWVSLIAPIPCFRRSKISTWRSRACLCRSGIWNLLPSNLLPVCRHSPL